MRAAPASAEKAKPAMLEMSAAPKTTPATARASAGSLLSMAASAPFALRVLRALKAVADAEPAPPGEHRHAQSRHDRDHGVENRSVHRFLLFRGGGCHP